MENVIATSHDNPRPPSADEPLQLVFQCLDALFSLRSGKLVDSIEHEQDLSVLDHLLENVCVHWLNQGGRKPLEEVCHAVHERFLARIERTKRKEEDRVLLVVLV